MDGSTFIRPFFFAENEDLIFENLYTLLELLKIYAGASDGPKVSIPLLELSKYSYAKIYFAP